MKFGDALASRITRAAGSSLAVYGIVTVVGLWVAVGIVRGFTPEYRGLMDTASGIIALIMAFFILNSQNRDTAALQAKADEEVRATNGARNELVGIEKRESESGIEEKRLNHEDCNAEESKV